MRKKDIKLITNISKAALYIALMICLHGPPSYSQGMIYSKEGRQVISREIFIGSCLKGMKKSRADYDAVNICECQLEKMNRRFTNKQVASFTTRGVIDLNGLVQQDEEVKKAIEDCYTASGVATLLSAESFKDEFVASCIKNIKKSTEKTLDEQRVTAFCNCQLNMVTSKKISDADIATLNDPNSLLYYQMMYTCGDPFLTKNEVSSNWTSASNKDVAGPAIDTISMLSLNGMAYVKLKIGSLVQVWLLDTGASDMLINNDMEATLLNEGVLNTGNYTGTKQYEMANGMVDTCRTYTIGKLQIGKYVVDNLTMAVTDKGKRIIAGKGLLNKFSQWVIDNRKNALVLER